jgi:acetyl esterase/lipase
MKTILLILISVIPFDKLYSKTELIFSPQYNLSGDLWLPKTKISAPLIIVVHGGSWSSRSNSDMFMICRALTKRGFAVFNINYRKAPQHPFPAAIDDFKLAVKFIKNNAQKYNINFSQLGAWGYSAGAQIAALGALELHPEIPFQAIISGAGPMNLTLFPEDKAIKTYLNTNYQSNPALFKAASPYYSVTKNSPPMFFYHSKADKTVKFKHTEQLISKLKELNIPYDLYEVPNKNHILTFLFIESSIEQGIGFLKKYFK